MHRKVVVCTKSFGELKHPTFGLQTLHNQVDADQRGQAPLLSRIAAQATLSLTMSNFLESGKISA